MDGKKYAKQCHRQLSDCQFKCIQQLKPRLEYCTENARIRVKLRVELPTALIFPIALYVGFDIFSRLFS